MYGVFDHAGSRCISQFTTHRVLPSTPDNGVGTQLNRFSGLNTQPVHTAVNASPTTLRMPTHDSRPPWFARPSVYDSFIHYPLPVSRRTVRSTTLRLG
jgi:hypothetical protein